MSYDQQPGPASPASPSHCNQPSLKIINSRLFLHLLSRKNSLNFLLCEALSSLNHFSLKTGSYLESRVPSSLHCTQHGQAPSLGYDQIANSTGQLDAPPNTES